MHRNGQIDIVMLLKSCLQSCIKHLHTQKRIFMIITKNCKCESWELFCGVMWHDCQLNPDQWANVTHFKSARWRATPSPGEDGQLLVEEARRLRSFIINSKCVWGGQKKNPSIPGTQLLDLVHVQDTSVGGALACWHTTTSLLITLLPRWNLKGDLPNTTWRQRSRRHSEWKSSAQLSCGAGQREACGSDRSSSTLCRAGKRTRTSWPIRKNRSGQHQVVAV